MEIERMVACAETTAPAKIPGAVVAACEACRTSIWLSPNTQRLRASVELTVLCLPCAYAVLEPDAIPTVAPGDEELADRALHLLDEMKAVKYGRPQ